MPTFSGMQLGRKTRLGVYS